MNWHIHTADFVFEKLKSSSLGLDPADVSQRRSCYGPNEFITIRKKNVFQLFLKQFSDIMMLVLFAAVLFSIILDEYTDAIVILIILLLNAVISFIQEYRAGKAVEALRKLGIPTAVVIRNGFAQKVKVAELVPGDIVLLEAGTRVPADLRLVESYSLKIDESSLTGESVPADKITAPLSKTDLALSEQGNMAFKGTIVTYGRGRGVVTAIGIDTELGKITQILQQDEPLTPLQLRMKDFSRRLTVIVAFICIILFVIGFLKGYSTIEMLRLSLSTAVAAIPEALPAILTISLAMGASRMTRHHVLIRKLYAVESLGSVSFICSDKTGTLTRNKMQAARIWAPEDDNDQHTLLKAMLLNHNVEQQGKDLVGDPTETALVQYVQQQDVYPELSSLNYKRVDEIPFDSDRKLMTTIYEDSNGYWIVTKGAFEAVSAVCSKKPDTEQLQLTLEAMAEEGFRVIAYAGKRVRRLPDKLNAASVERDLQFLGLVGLTDQLRDEVKSAIDECKEAGIVPVMITGDHPATAAAIARKLGILTVHEDLVLTGSDLNNLDEQQLEAIIEKVKVYARTSPTQKLRIIRALQKKKHFVAMTGDGVNDAPSVKMADIGIAMGITGTDVTREAAHMVLLDDNYATIVSAIKQGRRIYSNIQKFIQYLMAGSIAELFTILSAPIIGMPMALLPVHILWINLVTDGLPALALAAEPAEKDIMKKPPHKYSRGFFTGSFGLKIVLTGLFIGVIALGSQFVLLNKGIEHWQTMVFNILCFGQLWQVLAIRSEKELLVKKGIFTNLYLLGAVLLTVLLQLSIIYIPFLSSVFHTAVLSAKEFAATVVISSFVFIGLEFSKLLHRK